MFRVGDIVRIIDPRARYFNYTGIVRRFDGDYYHTDVLGENYEILEDRSYTADRIELELDPIRLEAIHKVFVEGYV